MVGRKRGRGEEEEISLDCDNGHPMVLVPKEVRTSCLARIDTSMNIEHHHAIALGATIGERHILVLRWPTVQRRWRRMLP